MRGDGPVRDGGQAEPVGSGEPEIDRTFSRRIRQMSRRGEHDAVIAALREKVDAGDARPWMYDVLALTLRLTGADEETVADALLGRFDLSDADPNSLLAAAGYLGRMGATARAVELCRRASDQVPDASEPYQFALRLIDDPADRPADAAWAAAGILRTLWGPRHAAARAKAEAAAETVVLVLREAGDAAELAAAEAALADAAAADLAVRVTWAGDADVDLTVTEPGGTAVSTLSRRSAGGGLLARDGFGPGRETAVEEYRAARGYSGVYLLNVGLTRGEPVGQRVRVEVTRHAGSPAESVERFSIPLKAENTPSLVTLRGGRRTAPAAVTAAAPPPPPQRVRLADLVDGNPDDRGRLTRRLGGRQVQGGGGGGFAGGGGVAVAPGAVGYNPVIGVAPDGLGLSALAVVSADRRFVRLSLAPQFAQLIDLTSFSFQTAPGQ